MNKMPLVRDLVLELSLSWCGPSVGLFENDCQRETYFLMLPLRQMMSWVLKEPPRRAALFTTAIWIPPLRDCAGREWLEIY